MKTGEHHQGTQIPGQLVVSLEVYMRNQAARRINQSDGCERSAVLSGERESYQMGLESRWNQSSNRTEIQEHRNLIQEPILSVPAR